MLVKSRHLSCVVTAFRKTFIINANIKTLNAIYKMLLKPLFNILYTLTFIHVNSETSYIICHQSLLQGPSMQVKSSHIIRRRSLSQNPLFMIIHYDL